MSNSTAGIFGEFHLGEIDPGFRFFWLIDVSTGDTLGEVVVDYQASGLAQYSQHWFLYEGLYQYPSPANPSTGKPASGKPFKVTPHTTLPVNGVFDADQYSKNLQINGIHHTRQSLVVLKANLVAY